MTRAIVLLRGGDVCLVLDARGPGLPVITYWGEDLGPEPDLEALVLAAAPAVARSTLDTAVPLSLLPERAVGHRGRPGLSGSREGRDFSPLFALQQVHEAPGALVVEAADGAAGLSLRVDLQLSEGGLLLVRHQLRNDGDEPYRLQELACVLPVPDRATELMDLTGRWIRERHPQRHPFTYGTFARETRHGRPGHDATLLLAAGTPGFGNRTGELWAVHLGWSGDSTSYVERGPGQPAALGTAELLAPGEVVLEPGQEYVAPWTYAAWSRQGLDGISAVFHRWLRARPGHPRTPRPVVLNTWEAVYFDHDLGRLQRLADTAAEVGVERFVLDDGWFRGRRDDTRGLGDWAVDPDLWPDGLAPLIDHVLGLGMEFGLWVEPEMVNMDSELVRAHPDWVAAVPGRLPPEWRHQQVLDLTHPGAFAHVMEHLDALLRDHAISFVKWDHNRDLVEAADSRGRPSVHGQTLAVYRLLDELRERHPGVEIESCASGGARVDLGILQRTDRVWASDTNDALERQGIQRWTGLLLPPELVGAHVGPPRAHTTDRLHPLAFRVATALFGSFGFEWDITDEDRSELGQVVATYKRLRGLLHTGTVVNGDLPDPSASLHGVVAVDRRSAVFAYVQLTTSTDEVPGTVLLPGLEPSTRYDVRPLVVAGGAHGTGRADPPWWQAGSITLSGRELGAAGLRLPVLHPEQALLLELTAR